MLAATDKVPVYKRYILYGGRLPREPPVAAPLLKPNARDVPPVALYFTGKWCLAVDEFRIVGQDPHSRLAHHLGAFWHHITSVGWIARKCFTTTILMGHSNAVLAIA